MDANKLADAIGGFELPVISDEDHFVTILDAIAYALGDADVGQAQELLREAIGRAA